MKSLISRILQKLYLYPRLRLLIHYLRAPFSTFSAYCYFNDKVARGLMTNGEYRVRNGPYRGMLYTKHGSSVSLPCLLGTYEMEIWPVLESLKSQNYDMVIDVGCAEGYHACGIARMTGKKVLAYDMLDSARKDCSEMARINGVSDLVQVNGFLEHQALNDMCRTNRVFVFCDIDFAEIDLMDPAKIPNLAEADLLIETHAIRPGGEEDTLPTIISRFEATHHIRRFDMKPRFAASMWDFVEGDSPNDFRIGPVINEMLATAYFEPRGHNNWLWLKSKRHWQPSA